MYLAIVLFFYTIQRNLIYFLDAYAPTPEEAGVPEMEEIKLQTKDGLSIKAWIRPAESNLPTIVYFHGNASHIGNRAPIIKPFLNKGYGVLLFTYRGYSGNSGKPSEQELYADA